MSIKLLGNSKFLIFQRKALKGLVLTFPTPTHLPTGARHTRCVSGTPHLISEPERTARHTGHPRRRASEPSGVRTHTAQTSCSLLVFFNGPGHSTSLQHITNELRPKVFYTQR